MSGTQTPYPFQFGGAQYDPTGCYGSYSPRLAHSLSGANVPYTGQGAAEFGHTPGSALPSHSGGVSNPVQAALRGVDLTSTLYFSAAALAPEAPPLAVSAVVAVIATILNEIFGGIFDFGGSAPVLPPRDFRKAHMIPSQFIGTAPGLVADNAQPRYPMIRCRGTGRGLSGNTSLVSHQGGIPGQVVQSGTAAVIPQQFGVPSGAALARYAPYIHGTVGQASFSAVTDVIGGRSPIPGMNVRAALQQEYPGQLIIEIPGATDQGANAPTEVFVPRALGCPGGTTQAGGG